MQPLTAPHRPDLRKQPLFFEAVKGVGVGAIVGSGVALAGKAYNAIRKEPVFKASVADNALEWGTIWGAMYFAQALARNIERSETKPYVQKLEAELAAKNAILDDSIKR